MARSHVSLLAVLAVLATPLSSVAGVYAPPYGGGGGGGGASPGGISGDIQTNNGVGGFGAISPGAGVPAWLVTPSSANLRGALTDETGTGAAVFANSPSLISPNLGIPSAVDLTNAVNVPLGNAAGMLGVNHGGTGQTAYTDGQLLIGNTATGGLSKASLTAGSNITITPGNGSITIAASGGSASAGGSGGQVQVNSGGALAGRDLGTGLTDDGTKIALTSVNNDQTSPAGNAYTVVAGDAAKTVLVAGGNTYSLPDATVSGFGAGWSACFLNTGASSATISASASLFKGASGTNSLTIRPGSWACPASDGTNYQTVFGANGFGLTANAPLIGGGAGAVPTVGTRSGNTTEFVTWSGSKTTGNLTKLDASGNIVDSGIAAVGGGSGDVTGPASSVDSNIAAFNGTTGKVIKDSGKALPSGPLADTNSPQAFSNKTIDCSVNTCTNFPGGGSGAAVLTFSTAGTTSINSTNVYVGMGPGPSHINARAIPIPFNGTLSGLQCRETSGGPGTGNVHTFTLSLTSGAGAAADNTNQQVTISDTNVTSTTVTNVGVPVSAGDSAAMHLSFTGTAPSQGVVCTVKLS